jgi:hypothetical protein
MLCLKEWNLDSLLYRTLWNPLKWAGSRLNFLTVNRVLVFFIPVYVLGLLSLLFEEKIPDSIEAYMPVFFAFIGLVMVLKAFTERRKARMSWLLIIMNHFWVALAISFNEQFHYTQTLLYLSGISVFGAVGFICLSRIKTLETDINLDQFHGHSLKRPKLAFIFFLACLGVTGFPITPTFIGEDLIFSHIHENQIILAFFVSLSFIIDGLAIIRIYARIFLGPHVKSIYESAYRSS